MDTHDEKGTDMEHDLGPVYAAEQAVDRALALRTARRPDSMSYHRNTTRMHWRDTATGTKADLTITENAGVAEIAISLTMTPSIVGCTITVDRIEASEMLDRIAAAFPSPIGRILWDEEKDRYDNSVSIAILPGGRRLRIVRHERKKPWHSITRSTVYRSKGSFVRIEKRMGRDDTCYDDLKVAGYRMCWGDGELGPVEQNPAGPDLKSRIDEMAMHQDDENAILCVLTAIVDVDDLWEVRDVAPRLAA